MLRWLIFAGPVTYITTSSTVPIIMELKYHLEEMSKKAGVARLSEKLRDESVKRFDNI